MKERLERINGEVRLTEKMRDRGAICTWFLTAELIL